MLSSTPGEGLKRAAVIRHWHASEYLYVGDVTDNPIIGNPISTLGQRFFTDLRLSRRDLAALELALMDGVLPENATENVQDAYDKARAVLGASSSRGKVVEIEDNGKLYPVPTGEPERIYISAPSGAGKSTFIANYMKEARLINPSLKIYIFSKVKSDPAFSGIKKLHQVVLDADFIASETVAEDLKNSLVIFDDYTQIADKALLKAVEKLRDDVLECGRHSNISVLVTSHIASNYNSTRRIIQESTAFVFYPRAGSTYQTNRFLKLYVGLDNKQIERVMRLPSRWVMINLMYPKYILHEHGAFVL